MTIIHECDRCNAPGRVIETSDGFRCEGCYEEAQEQVRSDASCPECGRLGVTATGICYACENTAPVRRGITSSNPFALIREERTKWQNFKSRLGARTGLKSRAPSTAA